MRIPGLLAALDRLARAATWLVAHTNNLLVALPVFEATVCMFFVTSEPLMAMLDTCTVCEEAVASMAASVCGVHGFVANVNLLVR